MPLYDATKAKERLSILANDNNFDTIIASLGSQADSEILQRIQIIKPDFDVNAEDNNQIIKDASTDRLVAYVYLVKMKYESYREFLEKSNKAIELFMGEAKHDHIAGGKY